VRRLRLLSLVLATLPLFAGQAAPAAGPGSGTTGGVHRLSSSPPDRHHYVRPLLPADLRPFGKSALPAGMTGSLDGIGVFLRDPIVSNTDPNLINNDKGGDQEPSIAVNPQNRNEIVISAFARREGFYRSTDGGNTWTFVDTYTQPPGQGGIPKDQSIDYGRSNLFAGTFLTTTGNVVTGTTTYPANNTSWSWPLDASGNVVPANTTSAGHTDQPWLLIGPQPGNLTQDNIYTAYDAAAGTSANMQVVPSSATTPTVFGPDQFVGFAFCCVNAGQRLAVDSRTGYVYDVWQNGSATDNVTYMLNRSTDAGQTWGLNGSPGGIPVATADTDQPLPKFGTVNELLGGVDHAAVDPVSGDVYVAYGARDASGKNHIDLARLQYDGAGNLNVTNTSDVTGPVQAALPSVAVASNGVVGILYDTFDGFSSDGFPIFSARLALSDDHGASFANRVLETFLSPAKDTCASGLGDCNDTQRVLGDYQEMKAQGRTFYGTFTGNGAPFGHVQDTYPCDPDLGCVDTDPIFFKASAGGPTIAVSGNLNFGVVPRGTTAQRDVIVTNIGTEPLVVNGVTFTPASDPAYSVAPNPGVPVTLQPSDSITYTVLFSPSANSGPGTRTGTLQIQSNDPDTPTVNLAATGQVGVPQATLNVSALDFGGVATDDRTSPNSVTRTVTLSNTGAAGLTLISLATTSSDFTATSPVTLPTTIAPGSDISVSVTFNPSAPGARSGTLYVNTDDPVTPSPAVSLVGNGLIPGLAFSPGSLTFAPTVLTTQVPGYPGSTLDLGVTNSGQTELIVDSQTTSGAPFSVPAAASPPDRYAPNIGFTLPVTFGPTATGKFTGTVTIADDGNGEAPVSGAVSVCGEGVQRGIRVLVVNASGTPYSTLLKLKLMSHNTSPGINIVAMNLPLVPVATSCVAGQQEQYENQSLPAAPGGTGPLASYYTLAVSVGGRSATVNFTLQVDEFKQIVMTVK
jgi:HYDIN/CFA65/VesB-like, Ig-like domain